MLRNHHLHTQLPKAVALVSGLVVLCCCTLLCATDKSSEPTERPQTYQELIAERPVPNLKTLVERSSPELRNEDSREAFLDVLKLREIADAKTVPVLEQILATNISTGRIHGFAAAQALFAIGTPEAHQILARHSQETHAALAVNYTWHWEMREPLRNAYIERYLMKDLSDDVLVKLEQSPAGANGPLKLEVIFHNASDEAIYLTDQEFPGDMLYLRDAKGRYKRRIHDRSMCPKGWSAIELKPGQEHRYQVTIDVIPVDATKRKQRATGALAAEVQPSGHYFDVDSPGRYELLALYESQPLSVESRKFLKLDPDSKWWTGRAVSKSLAIDIALGSK